MKHIVKLVLFLNICHVFCIFRDKSKVCDKNYIQFTSTNSLWYFLKILMLLTTFATNAYFVCALKNFALLNACVFAVCSLITVLVTLKINVCSVVKRAQIQKYLLKLCRATRKIEALMQQLQLVTYVDTFLSATIYFVAILGIYLLSTYAFHYDLLTGIIYNLGYTIPKMVIIINTMLFINYVTVLKYSFQMLNRHLSSINNIEEIAASVDIYCKLARLGSEMDQFFGYQNLTTVGYYVTWIIYEMYHIVLVVFFQSHLSRADIKLIQFSLSWIITNVFVIILLFIICQSLRNESELFKQRLWHLATFTGTKVSK